MVPPNYPASISIDASLGRQRVRQLAVARLVSTGGSQAASIALVFEIYSVTRSNTWVFAVLFASFCVSGFIAPASGWMADHFDRRRVMVISELLGAATYLGLVFVHVPALLVTGAFVAALVGAPFRAASAAAIPNIVAEGDLGWANGLLSTVSNVSLVGGPLLGGVLVAASSVSAVFAVNSATFVASGVAIALTGGDFGGLHRESSQHGLFSGFKLIVSSATLARLTAAGALAWGAFGSVLVMDPVLTRFFHAGSIGYGLLTTVWGGGAVVGAILAGRSITVVNARVAVTWGMAAMAVSLGSIVILPNFALIVAAGAVGGVGSGFVFVPWLLMVQHHSEDAVRGRVIAATETFDQIMFLTGMGLAVPTLGWLGPHHGYGLAGVLLALAAVIPAIRMAHVRLPTRGRPSVITTSIETGAVSPADPSGAASANQ